VKNSTFILRAALPDLLSALPFAVATCANLSGGFVSDALARRLLGMTALATTGLFTPAAMLTHDQVLTASF
jgi:hypothetical protein